MKAEKVPKLAKADSKSETKLDTKAKFDHKTPAKLETKKAKAEDAGAGNNQNKKSKQEKKPARKMRAISK